MLGRAVITCHFALKNTSKLGKIKINFLILAKENQLDCILIGSDAILEHGINIYGVSPVKGYVAKAKMALDNGIKTYKTLDLVSDRVRLKKMAQLNDAKLFCFLAHPIQYAPFQATLVKNKHNRQNVKNDTIDFSPKIDITRHENNIYSAKILYLKASHNIKKNHITALINHPRMTSGLENCQTDPTQPDTLQQKSDLIENFIDFHTGFRDSQNIRVNNTRVSGYNMPSTQLTNLAPSCGPQITPPAEGFNSNQGQLGEEGLYKPKKALNSDEKNMLRDSYSVIDDCIGESSASLNDHLGSRLGRV